MTLALFVTVSKMACHLSRPPVKDCRKWNLHSPLPEACHSRGHLQGLNSLFFFITSPPSIKGPGNQVLRRWLFWGASLLSSQSAGSLIKVSSLPQHLSSQWTHWPVVWQLVKIWLSLPEALLLVASWPRSGNIGARPWKLLGPFVVLMFFPSRFPEEVPPVPSARQLRQE